MYKLYILKPHIIPIFQLQSQDKNLFYYVMHHNNGYLRYLNTNHVYHHIQYIYVHHHIWHNLNYIILIILNFHLQNGNPFHYNIFYHLNVRNNLHQHHILNKYEHPHIPNNICCILHKLHRHQYIFQDIPLHILLLFNRKTKFS